MGPIEKNLNKTDMTHDDSSLESKRILYLFGSQSEIFLTDSHTSDLANRVFSEILPAKREESTITLSKSR